MAVFIFVFTLILIFILVIMFNFMAIFVVIFLFIFDIPNINPAVREPAGLLGPRRRRHSYQPFPKVPGAYRAELSIYCEYATYQVATELGMSPSILRVHWALWFGVRPYIVTTPLILSIGTRTSLPYCR